MDNEMSLKFNTIEKFLKEIKTDLTVQKTDTQENFKEIKIELAEMKSRINDTYNAVDGFIKIVDKLETEFVIIKEDLRRVKEVIKEKLGVDLS
jgi:sugar-specific transcriptional regulator TrmB